MGAWRRGATRLREIFMAVLCLSLLAGFWSLIGASAKSESSRSSKPSFLLLPIEGVIHGGTVEITKQALDRAKASHQGLIIQLDTPGGLLDSTRELVKMFLNSEVPIFVYVAPGGSRAGSAGTFLTLAAHVAAMAPGTNIGAAHPITISGKDPDKDGNKELARKIENDTIAFIETIANQRGRNVEWAKKAVKVSSSITETEAKKLRVIDFVARDIDDLLSQADGMKVAIRSGGITLKSKSGTIETMELSLPTKVLNALANPTVIFALITLMMLGIYGEISHPGTFIPAGIAVVALLLLLVASRTMPVSMLGVLLMILGFALLVAEIYITSFGLLMVAGLAAFFFGSMLLFDPAKVDVRVPMQYIWSVTLAIGCIAAAVGYFIARSFHAPQTAGEEGMIGMHGTVEGEQTGGEIRVFVNGEYWSASSDSALDAGDKVEVISIEGLHLKVKKQDGTPS